LGYRDDVRDAEALGSRPGELLAGRYELLEVLGRGGFGLVRCARDRVTGRMVAVKLMTQGSREAAARFAREARLLQGLTHPNTTRILDVGETPLGLPFIVMELLLGETLAARLGRGPLPADQALAIVRGVLLSLAEAHRRGIVHRDVKPSNIFVLQSGAGIKLMDFGIAKDPFSSTATSEFNALEAVRRGELPSSTGKMLTEAEVVIGSPRYMAPEQLSGELATAASDVYAVGLVLAEALTGAPVFRGRGVTSVIVDRAQQREPVHLAGVDPPWVAEWIARATEPDPARRFRDASEMLAFGPPRAPASKSSRARWWVGAVALGVAVGGVGGVAIVSRERDAVDVEVGAAGKERRRRDAGGSRNVRRVDEPPVPKPDPEALRAMGLTLIETDARELLLAAGGGVSCSALEIPNDYACKDLKNAMRGRPETILCHPKRALLVSCIEDAGKKPRPDLVGAFLAAAGLGP
jgi:hypothetical protein